MDGNIGTISSKDWACIALIIIAIVAAFVFTLVYKIVDDKYNEGCSESTEKGKGSVWANKASLGLIVGYLVINCWLMILLFGGYLDGSEFIKAFAIGGAVGILGLGIVYGTKMNVEVKSIKAEVDARRNEGGNTPPPACTSSA